MASDHNGYSYVTWRDAHIEFASQRDLDKAVSALTEKAKAHEKETTKALELAAEQLRLKLEEMNNFRQQQNEERGTFATKLGLEVAMEKLGLEIKNLIDTEVAERKSMLSDLRSQQTATSTSVRDLEKGASLLKGRDLGMLGLAGAGFIAIMSFISPVIRAALFG